MTTAQFYGTVGVVSIILLLIVIICSILLGSDTFSFSYDTEDILTIIIIIASSIIVFGWVVIGCLCILNAVWNFGWCIS